MSAEGTLEFKSARDALAAIVRCWARELEGFIQPSAGAPSLEVRAEGLALGNPGRLPARDIELRIAEPLVLRRSLVLPTQSRRAIARILDYEIEKFAPAPPAQLYFDFVQVNVRPQESRVLVRIVHREVIDAALRTLHEMGASATRLWFGDDDIEADYRRFPLDRAAWLRGRWRRSGTLALGALAVVFALLLATTFLVRQETLNDALRTRLTGVQQRAENVGRLQRAIDARLLQFSWLDKQRRKTTFVATLNELTRVLPNDSWLRELSYDGNEFHASGYSKDPMALIGAVDHSAMFTNAAYAAPTIHDASAGADRFELTFQRAEGLQ